MTDERLPAFIVALERQQDIIRKQDVRPLPKAKPLAWIERSEQGWGPTGPRKKGGT